MCHIMSVSVFKEYYFRKKEPSNALIIKHASVLLFKKSKVQFMS